ncbi:MAG: 3-oxoacyl-ACP synthase III family protein [Streptosporangiaceae bacterium]
MSSVAGVIPQRRPTLFELSDRYDMNRAELMVFHRIYGLYRVPVWPDSVTDLVEEAVIRLLKQDPMAADRVRWLVHAHTGSQQNVVSQGMLTRICGRLGLHRTQPFGMTTNNCASTISALQVLDRLLARGEPDAEAILVCADVAFTPILQIIPNSSVTGDAAVACLLRRGGAGHRILATRVDIYGQHAGCQWQDEAANAEFETEYPARVTLTMRRALTEAGLTWDDIRLVLPHNVNIFSWKRVAAQAGIPVGLIYLDQVPETAHCFGADIFLNFAEAEREGRFAPGDKIMLATVGLGAVFAAVIVEYGSPR